MAISTHPKNKVAYYFPNGKSKNKGITSDEVKDLALSTIIEYVQIIRPERVLYSIEEIFSVLLHAASNRTTIEQASETMKDTPHPNTVRLALKQLDIEELEREINEALVSHLPRKLFGKPLEAAADIKLIPYYGEPKEGDRGFHN